MSADNSLLEQIDLVINEPTSISNISRRESSISADHKHCRHVSISTIVDFDAISSCMDSDSDCNSCIQTTPYNEINSNPFHPEGFRSAIQSVTLNEAKNVTLTNRLIKACSFKKKKDGSYFINTKVAEKISVDEIAQSNSGNKSPINETIDSNIDDKSSTDQTISKNDQLCSDCCKINKWWYYVTFFVFFLISLLVSGVTIYFYQPENTELDISKVNYFARKQWAAKPLSKNYSKLELPIKHVIIAHTEQLPCYTEAHCSLRMKDLEYTHLGNGYGMIGYNFVVGGDGNVYEGCGWKIEGAHIYHYKEQSIYIAFIGNFDKVEPPKQQLAAAQYVIHEGMVRKKLDNEFKIYGQRDLQPTISPGEKLYKIIIQWDHFKDDFRVALPKLKIKEMKFRDYGDLF